MNATETAEDLWLQFLEGNGTAYKRLYDQYAGPLFNYGCKFSADRQFVKDCLHDLFTKLWSNRASLGVTPSVKNYLYKAFRNTLVKKQSAFRRIVPGEDAGAFAFSIVSPHEEKMIRDESQAITTAHLQQLIMRLTRKQREVIFLKFYEERSYAEIAQIMNVSVKAVYHIMARALQTLKADMGTQPLSPAVLLLISLQLSSGMLSTSQL